MKKVYKLFVLAALTVGISSCKQYLDINDNPNTATSATPTLVLPQALTATASVSNTFNLALADLGGQFANAGGFGGFGSVVTYAYTSSNFTGLWTASYDNLQDYQYIIDNTSSSDPNTTNANSIARIMKSFGFARLVDQYNDVPYSEALTGSNHLTPKYDKAEDIYKDLVAQLNLAIKNITAAQSDAATQGIKSANDPMFRGNMDNWKRFANTLKLRLLIKMAGVPSTQAFATTEFGTFNTGIGFLADDAVVNPGYVRETGKQNPTFNSLGFAVDGTTRALTSRIPTKYVFSFYNGVKLSDPGRGSVTYRSFPSTPTNQQGDESASVPTAPASGTAWFTGTNGLTNALGIVKGPSQSQVIMLKAESDFLQAEAYARGYLSGNAATAFNNGITSSFRYLYKDVNDVVDPSKNVTADVNTYLTTNSTSYLANFSLATTLAQKIEAIITQKYIALNTITSDEAYNEFRRTDYPKIVNGSLSATATFASLQSTSTRPDKLVARILYPQVEYNLNSANAPSGINLFTSRIFWDLN